MLSNEKRDWFINTKWFPFISCWFGVGRIFLLLMAWKEAISFGCKRRSTRQIHSLWYCTSLLCRWEVVLFTKTYCHSQIRISLWIMYAVTSVYISDSFWFFNFSCLLESASEIPLYTVAPLEVRWKCHRFPLIEYSLRNCQLGCLLSSMDCNIILMTAGNAVVCIPAILSTYSCNANLLYLYSIIHALCSFCIEKKVFAPQISFAWWHTLFRNASRFSSWAGTLNSDWKYCKCGRIFYESLLSNTYSKGWILPFT